ncbi:MAG: hypothetical protein ACYCOU_09860 [Sulfobacillus sp.]
MKVYGIAYCVRTEAGKPFFTVSATYCYSDGPVGFIALPRSWSYIWPLVDAHQFQKYGASQVQGLFGGVDDQWQKARSEAVERAIGDVVTRIVCEVLDSQVGSGELRIFILGPALYKLIGRIASLRPPAEVCICWVCPLPFPQWIAEGANEPVLLPSYDIKAGASWEEEPLVTTTKEQHCILQVLSIWSPEKVEPLHLDSSLEILLWGSLLPREIVVASGQVQIHTCSPYTGSSTDSSLLFGERLLPMENEWKCHQCLYTALHTDVAGNEDTLSGWPVVWN